MISVYEAALLVQQADTRDKAFEAERRRDFIDRAMLAFASRDDFSAYDCVNYAHQLWEERQRWADIERAEADK